MKKLLIVASVLSILFCVSCRNKNNMNKPVVSSSPKMEKKDTAIYKSYDADSINKVLLQEMSKAEMESNSIYGDWFKPHEACYVNIVFHKNKTFEMWDYDVLPNDSIVDRYRYGSFSVKGDSIYLKSNDHRNLIFRCWKACANGKAQKYIKEDVDNGWADLDYQDQRTYLTIGNDKDGFQYWLVKGSC